MILFCNAPAKRHKKFNDWFIDATVFSKTASLMNLTRAKFLSSLENKIAKTLSFCPRSALILAGATALFFLHQWTSERMQIVCRHLFS